MTKFEEILRKIKPRKKFLEFNAGITYWYCLSDLIQKFGNWHSDEEFQIVEEIGGSFALANKNLIDANTKLTEEIADLKSRLQQQALPVVPECVAEWIEHCKGMRYSLIGALTYKLSSTMHEDLSAMILKWLENEGNDETFALAFITGKYQVEKPKLFYLKNKLTTSYLALDTNTGYYEHWGEEIIPKLLKKQGYEISFTQEEIDSMQTGSYEQIEVAE